MTFKGIQFFETDDEEAARLAQAPVGSTSHSLSLLPVTNSHPNEHQLIELPWGEIHPCSGTTGGLGHECDGGHRLVVIPLKRSRGSTDESLPRRYDDYWGCRVMASDHPSYSVGGHDLSISESELRRGRVLEV
jgi:hypothetical protein